MITTLSITHMLEAASNWHESRMRKLLKRRRPRQWINLQECTTN